MLCCTSYTWITTLVAKSVCYFAETRNVGSQINAPVVNLERMLVSRAALKPTRRLRCTKPAVCECPSSNFGTFCLSSAPLAWPAPTRRFCARQR